MKTSSHLQVSVRTFLVKPLLTGSENTPKMSCWAPGVIEPGLEIEKRRRRFHACAIKLCLCHKTFVRPSCLMLCHKGRSADIGESVVVLGQQRLKNSLKMPGQRWGLNATQEYSPVHFTCRPIVQHASLKIKQHHRVATDAHEFRVLWTVWICHKNFELSRATQEISTSDLFW